MKKMSKVKKDKLRAAVQAIPAPVGVLPTFEAETPTFEAETQSVGKQEARTVAPEIPAGPPPNPSARTITEKDKCQDEWYKQAHDVKTPDDLLKFVKHLLEDYNHDYGTICHAIAAAAVAGAWCIDHDPRQGGITGFQASCITWELLKHWSHIGVEGPARILEYKDMLFPQYVQKFTMITESTWKWLQAEAKKLLKNQNLAHPQIQDHWRSVAGGKVPFGYKVVPKEKPRKNKKG